ncbi:MAG: tetratricopeptide repeat protein [Nitrospinota bacterium]
MDAETGAVLHTAQSRGATEDADKLFDSLNFLADAAIEALNKRVVVLRGKIRVARAAPAERITPTPRERERLHRAPAASLTAFALYGKGLEAQKQFRWDEAIRLFRRALEKDPDYAAALNGLGIVLMDKGRWGEALRSYKRALAHLWRVSLRGGQKRGVRICAALGAFARKFSRAGQKRG